MQDEFIYYCIDIPTAQGGSYRSHEGYLRVSYSIPQFADDLDYEPLGHYGEVSWDNKIPIENRLERLLPEEQEFLEGFKDEIGEKIFEAIIEKHELPYRENEHGFGHHEYFGRRTG